MKVIEQNPPSPHVTAASMDIGDVAQIIPGSHLVHGGEYILRDYAGLVSLSKPHHTWDKGYTPQFVVRILPPGTELTIIL